MVKRSQDEPADKASERLKQFIQSRKPVGGNTQKSKESSANKKSKSKKSPKNKKAK